jgi:hypothetical protein
MKSKWLLVLLLVVTPVLAACAPLAQLISPATPTVDPDIYNQVPVTTVYEPGECTAVLNAPVPAYTSNTLGGAPSGEIPAGQYEVGVAADYGSSVWLMLNGVDGANWVNKASVTSLGGACAEES